MPDSVRVAVEVGMPNEPAVAVSRAETITVESPEDTEAVAIEALRVVDRLCNEVRAEVLRQTRIVMENVKRQQQQRAG